MADLINRDKRLIEYLPPFMQQFKEMKEVMRVEDAKFDVMASDTEMILKNAFIEDCDEYGIKKYEKFLGIVVSADDTIEIRKSRVLLHWNNEVPYTYRVLIAKLNSYCGVNNYDVIADLERYNIEFNIYSDETQVAEIEEFIDTILPMNIIYTVYYANKHLGICNTSIIWQDDEVFQLRQVAI